jgi:Na+-driven multidrug efflux pump
MYREVSGALINIVLSIKFIPIFGISGAAYSTIIAILASSYLFDYFDKRTRPMFWQKTEALLFVKPFIQKAF